LQERQAVTHRLGVLGWPVAHSLSPTIQNAALAEVGLADRWRYQLLPVPPEVFDETVRSLPALGFRGVNVTIPHKSPALALATDASPRATAIGAANTLLFQGDGRLLADNTDAPALIAALAQRLDVVDCSALVLGAGGSARAAVWALLDAGAREVHIWNRTPERAAELAAAFGVHAVAVADAGTVADTDVLINCTSVGLDDDDRLEALPLTADHLRHHRLIVDLVYRTGGTPLTAAAESVQVPAIDGLELLVGQGAIAFELFTGVPAPLEAMRLAVGLSSPP
jgi:shikimate dehydrogenase